MITFFTTAKPFRGHSAIIQRNALQSWKRLHSRVEIIVFGDDEGSVEVCSELGLRHEPVIGCNEFGTTLVSAMFSRTQAIAQSAVLCYINCDIILTSDFSDALQRVNLMHHSFLMVGRRWDIDIKEPLEVDQDNWQARLLARVRTRGEQRPGDWIDYFAFSRGLYGNDMPCFAVGRTAWDNWLVWKALESGATVVDASRVVMAVHQNHDYAHHALGEKGVWRGVEAIRNQELAKLEYLAGIYDASVILTAEGFTRNYALPWLKLKRSAERGQRALTYKVWLPVWHFFLELTRPLRARLGLRSASQKKSSQAGTLL